MKNTTRLKRLIEASSILTMPAAYDAVSARVIEQVGFQAVSLAGYGATASVIGQPDLSLLTLTEKADLTRRIADAVDIPIFVDGDTGHGNVTHVIRTTRVLEAAGASGFFIEDQVFPKRCGHLDGKQIVSAAEMVAKIKSAVDTRRDTDLVIMARTDALAIDGLNAAIDRANLYREAGADLLFVESPKTREDMARISREILGPTMTTQGEDPVRRAILTTKELEDLGYSVVGFPASCLFAATWAVRCVMSELVVNGTTAGCRDYMVSWSEFNQFIGLPQALKTESQYYAER
jgi:methylisocitrate lyase